MNFYKNSFQYTTQNNQDHVFSNGIRLVLCFGAASLLIVLGNAFFSRSYAGYHSRYRNQIEASRISNRLIPIDLYGVFIFPDLVHNGDAQFKEGIPKDSLSLFLKQSHFYNLPKKEGMVFIQHIPRRWLIVDDNKFDESGWIYADSFKR